MSAAKVFSIADLRDRAKSNGTKYVEVEVWGGKLRLASVSSLAVVTWIAENEDKDLSKDGGLRLLARSIVDEDGNRVTEARPGSEEERNAITEFVDTIKDKDSTDNGNAILAALSLNNLVGAKLREKLKNASSETTSDELPSVSQ